MEENTAKESIKPRLRTKEEITWCPGCPDHMIMEAFSQTVARLVDTGQFKHEDFAMTADVGCHAKIFDYLNLSGVYCLHGRALPTSIGMKIGNPNLLVSTFVGDGALYSEGLDHLIHAFKYNANTNLIVHDNQSFSLTTGQPTPTSQQGFISKSLPLGVVDRPLNPLLLALSSNATFVARTNARDIPHMVETFTKAFYHNGFSFVEVIQDCIIFNLDINNKDARMYKVEDNFDKLEAFTLVQEFDYNSKEGKIPLGVIYQEKDAPSLSDKWPQLKKLQEKNVNWVDKGNLMD